MKASIMSSHSPVRPSSRARAIRAAAALLAISLHPAAAAAQAFDCVIDPSETVKIGSPIPGLFDEVLVKRGDVVARDQVIARLESSVEAKTVALNRFRAESTAKIDAQQQRVSLALARLERSSALFKNKIESQDKYEERRADAAVASQDLIREEQERQLATFELERSESLLRQRTIRSPIDGIVTEKKLSAGEYIHQEGYVVIVTRLDPLFVEAFVPVGSYGRIKVGMTATVRPDEPIGGSHIATVSVVDRVFDPSSSTYGIRLTLPNPDRSLPGGQRCKVSFDMTEKPPVQ
jgi:RND family efflux transporter MFP subunit